MKLLITLLAIATLSACASKKTAEAPAKTETPATVAADKSAADAKKEDKNAKKSAKKGVKAETAQTAANGTGTVGTAEVNCKSGSDERKLAINVKGFGCELNYTKAGETKAIASQINGSEKCEEVITSIKEKLVAAGYTCQ